MQQFNPPTKEELNELEKYCPCRICRLTYFDKFMLWWYGNKQLCTCCFGCLKDFEGSKDHRDFVRYVEVARHARILNGNV